MLLIPAGAFRGKIVGRFENPRLKVDTWDTRFNRYGNEISDDQRLEYCEGTTPSSSTRNVDARNSICTSPDEGFHHH